MFTRYTYEDWLAAPDDKRELLTAVIGAYKGSVEFQTALTAQRYFEGDNDEIKNKYVVQLDSYETSVAVLDPSTGEPIPDPATGKPLMEKKLVKKEVKVAGTRLPSGFFFRFVTQQNQHLLANGVTLGDAELKKRLGRSFDTALSRMGECALVDGVCWGFWNRDHIEVIRAAVDGSSGAVALLSEEDSAPRVLVQFWRISEKKPLHVRVYEPDGVSLYKADEQGDLQEVERLLPYVSVSQKDAGGVFSVTGKSYGVLPVVPLYANPEKRSELTPSIKAKIDCFDRVASDFGDNLQMANDVYWVLNNFGGSTRDVLEILSQIREFRAVAARSDGMGGQATAEPHSFEVPYQARSIALDILKRELYRDYMGMDTEALTGGSLTNVAIRVASKDLNLKDDRYEWQVFDFVQGVLRLQGIETEEISFVRQALENDTETIENIYRAAEDLDRETRLKLNPMIHQDLIPAIMEAKTVEEASGLPSLDELKKQIGNAGNPTPAEQKEEDEDGEGQS